MRRSEVLTAKEIRMKRVLCLALALSLPVFSLAAEKPKKQLTFAYMSGILDPFMLMIEKGAKAKAKELGVKLIVGRVSEGLGSGRSRCRSWRPWWPGAGSTSSWWCRLRPRP